MKAVVAVLLATGVATAAVSAERFSTSGAAAGVSSPTGFEHAVEPFPQPVTGGELFAEASVGGGAPACLPVARILGIFAMDVEAVGGEILALSGGLEQEFADQWRQSVGMTPVDVTQVFAHVVPGEDGDAIVDVVEVDAEGCALSRTLLSQSDWLTLLGAVQGVEV